VSAPPPEEVVQAAYEAFVRRDAEAFAALVTDDVELSPAIATMLEGHVFRGRDAVPAFFANFDDMWDEFFLELGTTEVAGDRVLSLGRIRATARESGLAFDEETGSVSVVRDGKLASWRAFLSHQQALTLFRRDP
jgi:ketosteroid isomerase-like protein